MMDSRKILDRVRDVGAWKGDVYNLAMTIAAEQKAIDADIADCADAPAVAELIRAAD